VAQEGMEVQEEAAFVRRLGLGWLLILVVGLL